MGRKCQSSDSCVFVPILNWRQRRLSPQAGNRGRSKSLAERDDRIAIIKDNTKGKAILCGFEQLLQTRQVAGGHGCARLDFYPHDRAVIALENDVDFMSILVAEVERCEPDIRPGHELHDFGKHEAFEQRSERRAVRLDARKAQTPAGCQNSRVEEVQLGRFDDPLDRIGVPGLERRHEEDLLQESDIALARLVGDINATSERGIVDQLSGVLGKEPHELGQVGELLDFGDVAQITCEHRGEIGSDPVLPPSLACAAHGLRVAAGEDGPDQFVANDRVLWSLQVACVETLQERWFTTENLSLRQGQQVDRLHSSGEAVGDAWQRQHIGGAGQEEAAGAAIFVNRLLDGKKELRHTLNLVNDGTVQATYEAAGVNARGAQNRLVVERKVSSPPLTHGPYQRGLAGAPGADHESDRGVGQGFPYPVLHKALVQERLLSPAIRNKQSGN